MGKWSNTYLWVLAHYHCLSHDRKSSKPILCQLCLLNNPFSGEWNRSHSHCGDYSEPILSTLGCYDFPLWKVPPTHSPVNGIDPIPTVVITVNPFSGEWNRSHSHCGNYSEPILSTLGCYHLPLWKVPLTHSPADEIDPIPTVVITVNPFSPRWVAMTSHCGNYSEPIISTLGCYDFPLSKVPPTHSPVNGIDPIPTVVITVNLLSPHWVAMTSHCGKSIDLPSNEWKGSLSHTGNKLKSLYYWELEFSPRCL